MRRDAMLELDGLEVRYGSVAAVRGALLAVGARRARRPDRPERRRQVDDAARDHGRRSGGRRRRPPRGRIARAAVARSRSPARASRSCPEGRRIFGELTVEENLRLGLAARRRNGTAAATVRRGLRALPDPGGVPRRARPARSRAASSSSSRSAARSSPRRDVLLLDEPSLGPRAGASSTPSSARSRRSATEASPCCSSSSARSARSRSPTARTCSRTASCG